MSEKWRRWIRGFFECFTPSYSIYSKAGIRAVVRDGGWSIPESEYPKLWAHMAQERAELDAQDPYRREWRTPERRQPKQ